MPFDDASDPIVLRASGGWGTGIEGPTQRILHSTPLTIQPPLLRKDFRFIISQLYSYSHAFVVDEGLPFWGM